MNSEILSAAEEHGLGQRLIEILVRYEANDFVFSSKEDWEDAKTIMETIGVNTREIEKVIGDLEHDVFSTQATFAQRIFAEFGKGHQVVIAQAPMQFGKTGTQFYLANALIGSHYNKNVLFLTSMSDISLYKQNRDALTNRLYKGTESRIKVLKLSDFKKDPAYYINKMNVGYVFFDECDYGSGASSSIDESFFRYINTEFSEVKCLLISATPYDALYSLHLEQMNGTVVQAQAPATYFGVKDMLTYDMVEDLGSFRYLEAEGEEVDEDFDPEEDEIVFDEPQVFHLTDRFYSYVEDFVHSSDEGGLAIIRTTGRGDYNNPETIKNLLDEEFSDKMEVIVVGVKHDDIADTINKDLPNLVLREGKKVLLIVINALTAGKDLGEMKKYVRLVIETRNKQIANTCQGLVGRVCGYHNNRDIRIIAHVKSLEYYVALEEDYTNIFDDDFIHLVTMERMNVCTHLKKKKKGSDTEANVGEVRKFVPMSELESMPDSDAEDILKVLNGQRTKELSHIQSQTLSNYSSEKNIQKFHELVEKCRMDGRISMLESHRYRAEREKGTADRIKMFLVVVNKGTNQGVFIIDVLEEMMKPNKGEVTNKSSMYAKFNSDD